MPHSARRTFLRFQVALTVALLVGAGCTYAPVAETPGRTPAVRQKSAQDAFVVLSGGGTPLSNNYSQYLQARALNDWLRSRYPTESVWTFFGAGNRTDAAPHFGDTRKQNKDGNMLVESWLPGVIANNRPASREEFLGALKTEILPRVSGGGTLYLFVGDHGERSRDDLKESVITMWQMEKTGTSVNGWRSNSGQVLGVTELSAVLNQGLGSGRVVFCFTCCHSGGFHFLDQPRIVAPNPAWFTELVPAEAADWNAAPPPSRIAGFTATTEDSLAAGCAPDPDPDRWAGYERFIPEALLGIDLMSGVRKTPGLASFAEAHVAATLVDRTIDKPHSTAEAFLEAQATLIENLLEMNASVTLKVREQVERFARIVNGEEPRETDPAFVAQQKTYARFVAALVEQNPTSSALILSGTRAQLQEAVGPTSGNAGQGGRRRGASGETRKVWTDTLRPAWKAALIANQVADIPAAAREFELHVIGVEEKNPQRDLTPGNRDAVRNELFWRSGYAIPSKTDPEKAVTIARWEAGRRAAILAWARASKDSAVREAAEKWGGPVRPGAGGRSAPAWSGPARGARKEALQRVLFYRRVLGAWAFLIAMDERAALARFAALKAVEEMPLPKPQGDA